MSLIPTRCPTCGAETNRLYKQYWQLCQKLGGKPEDRLYYAELSGLAERGPTPQAAALNALKVREQCCRRLILAAEQSTHIWGGSAMPPPPHE